jgi:hypothetical protein
MMPRSVGFGIISNAESASRTAIPLRTSLNGNAGTGWSRRRSLVNRWTLYSIRYKSPGTHCKPCGVHLFRSRRSPAHLAHRGSGAGWACRVFQGLPMVYAPGIPGAKTEFLGLKSRLISGQRCGRSGGDLTRLRTPTSFFRLASSRSSSS